LFARLQKEFPQNPRYHFAWIAMSQIQADAMDPDDKMAQSLRLLALRSLKAAVDNALNDKVRRAVAAFAPCRNPRSVLGLNVRRRTRPAASWTRTTCASSPRYTAGKGSTTICSAFCKMIK
jgi:hypothetical protein